MMAPDLFAGARSGALISPDKIRENRSAEDQKCESPQRSVYDPRGCVTTHRATMHALRGDRYNYLYILGL